jgi:hypothetical protein
LTGRPGVWIIIRQNILKPGFKHIAYYVSQRALVLILIRHILINLKIHYKERFLTFKFLLVQYSTFRYCSRLFFGVAKSCKYEQMPETLDQKMCPV